MKRASVIEDLRRTLESARAREQALHAITQRLRLVTAAIDELETAAEFRALTPAELRRYKRAVESAVKARARAASYASAPQDALRAKRELVELGAWNG